jgi:hypothetical protein
MTRERSAYLRDADSEKLLMLIHGEMMENFVAAAAASLSWDLDCLRRRLANWIWVSWFSGGDSLHINLLLCVVLVK